MVSHRGHRDIGCRRYVPDNGSTQVATLRRSPARRISQKRRANVLKEQPPMLASAEPDREPPMVRDFRVAAILVVVVVVALLAVACSVSRQGQGPGGSATPDPALATRVAAAQARVDATRVADGTAAAITDATAAAQNTATATAQSALLTATSSPAATATSQPIAVSQATPGSTTQPQSTSVPTPAPSAYAANFATWDSGVKDAPYPARLSYDPTTKQYVIALTDAGRAYTYQTYTPEARYFADFRLDLSIQRVAGPASGGGYGVLFRALPQGANETVSPDFAFLVRPQEQSFALNQLSPSGRATNIGKGTTTAIKVGDAVNHLEVIAEGTQITLGINGTTVGTYPVTMTQAGAIGLIVSSPPQPPGTVGMSAAFTSLQVSPLPVVAPTIR